MAVLKKIPAIWDKWVRTGRHGSGARKKNALLKSLVNGQARGYYSDILLRPDLDPTDSMYPSIEHLNDPSNHRETVVETRLVNDMKCHLSEAEFWRVVEHLFLIGVEKDIIKAPFGKRLPKYWSPTRHYKKPAPAIAAALAESSDGGENSAKELPGSPR